MKLCIDCQHFLSRKQECEMHHSVSYVSGETIYTSAYLLRQTDAHCGKEGKWFTEKDTSDLDDLSTIPFGR